MTKIPFVENSLFQINQRKSNQTYSRDSTILPMFIKKTLLVHNGKQFIPISIHSGMLGFKLGEFVPTKITPVFKRNKKKK